MYDKNKILPTSADNNFQADYIRIKDGGVYLCRLDRASIDGLGLSLSVEQLLAAAAWQVCLVKKEGTDADGSFKFLYPDGRKDYGFACDDGSLSGYNFKFCI